MDTEIELGEKVKQYCIQHGIKIVPEYKGWDCVLYHRGMVAGCQLKLKFNIKAIYQCLQADDRVDFKLLIFDKFPTNSNRVMLTEICRGLKIIPVYYSPYDKFVRWLPVLENRHHPKKRLIAPDGEYDLPIGSRSPLTISDWKIAVIRLEQLAEKNGGWVLKRDINNLGLRSVPRSYVKYEDNKWWFYRSPSKDYPHIRSGLERG